MARKPPDDATTAHPAGIQAAKNRLVAAAIARAAAEFRVTAWLNGSTVKADRPTLAEVEACGYRVVPAAHFDSEASS